MDWQRHTPNLVAFWCLLIAVALFTCASYTQAQSQGDLFVEQTIQEDFQGDSLGQWASYPPVQDIGYEPSLTPTTDFGAPGGRALMRIVQPTRLGNLRFGFIKKIDLTSDEKSRFSFSYRLNTPSGSPTIEVGLAGTDGHRYTAEIKAVSNAWTKTELSSTEFRRDDGVRPVGRVGIEAVYIVAKLLDANPDTAYRFLIDDISISAGRAAQFRVITPQSERFEPWRSDISLVGFTLNDQIAIEASTPVSITGAKFALKSPSGKIAASGPLYDDGTHGDKRAGDGIWSNNSVYRLIETDAPGVWTAAITGTARTGADMATDLRFLVHPRQNNSHPRLYFDAGDKAKLLARSRDPKLEKLWQYVLNTAKTSQSTGELAGGGNTFKLLDKAYLLPTLLGYFDVLSRARSRIAYNAFVGYLNNDDAAIAAAKEALIDVSRWQQWEPPWFTAHGQRTYYPAGQLASDVALGYDLLYDRLTPAERSEVRRALIEKSIVPTYKEYFLDNRAMANTSNWIAHTVCGALIAASAIAGDVTPEESNGKFELYTNGLMLKLEAHLSASFLPDGSYGEGISYQEFDLETLAPATVALRRAYGVDYFNTTHLKDSLAYALYTFTDPKEASLDMGDTHPPGGHGIPALVYQSKDPVLRWYYQQFERPSLHQFIFYDDSVAPSSPESAKLPTSRIFATKGNAAFRTGWGPNEIAMLFRAGPTFNHHHADQGSFLISAFGESLVSEAGWSDYYKDPYYATYFTQAVGHNTVLVDGNPESQAIPDTRQFRALDDYPTITDSLTSEFFDGVGSELSPAYKGRLARYVRRIVFVKPYYFIVYDDLKANGTPAQLDLLLHFPDRDRLKTDGLTAIYSGSKASLGVRFFASNGGRVSVQNGRIPYPVFATATPAKVPAQPAYVDLEGSAASSEMKFITLLVPAKSEGSARDMIGRAVEVAGENVRGIRVARGDETDYVMFCADAQNTTFRQGEWSADASVVTVTTARDGLKMFAVQNGRILLRGKQTLFSSEAPASVAADFKAGEIEAVVNAGSANKIKLFAGKKPVRVQLDGRELKTNEFTFNSFDNTVTVTAPAGQHDFRIVL